MKLNKSILISFGVVIGSTFIFNYTFNRPTFVNKYIATHVFNSPANTAFTDDNFYQCVVESYNDEFDASVAYTESLSDEQLQSLTTLNCPDKQINITIGLEKINSLTYLNLDNNNLNDIDISQNIKLEFLYLDNNGISTLNLSANTMLKKIKADNNQLTELNINNNKELTTLSLLNNNINIIDLSKNSKLEHLTLNNNKLDHIDISQNIALEELHLSENNLSYVNLANNSLLRSIHLSNNNLNSIDLNAQVNLTSLYLDRNSLKSIDLSKNEKLELLFLYNNIMDDIDLSNNSKLRVLNIYDNNLNTLNLNQNEALTRVEANSNQLTEIDISKNNNLTDLYLSDNNLSTIDLSNNLNLIRLVLSSNNLTSLDISENIKLQDLQVTHNNLNSLKLSNNENLTLLAAHNNQIKKIDLNGAKNLMILSIYINELTSLDISNNEALTSVSAGNNQITEIDVSKNVNLTSLQLEGNNLKGLDVSSNVKLKDLNITNMGFQKEIAVYKSEQIDFTKDPEIIKLPEGISNSFKREASHYISDAGIGLFEKSGLYENNFVSYNHNIQVDPNNHYSVYYDVYVIEATSNKYEINTEQDYIYTGADIDSEIILSNIELNYGEAIIENNQLLIKYDDELVKTFDVVSISSNKYDFSSSYLYTGLEEFDESNVSVVNATTTLEDNILSIYRDEELIQQYPIVTISSETYDLNNEYIYLAQNELDIDAITATNAEVTESNNVLEIKYGEEIIESFDLVSISTEYDLTKDYIYLLNGEIDSTKINIINGTPEIIDNKLLIKYNATTLDEYDILEVNINDVKMSGDSIVIQNSMDYETLTNNISLNNDNLSYQILNVEEVVTSGNIEAGMTLNIYYNEEIIDTLTFVDKYIVSDKYIIDYDNLYIYIGVDNNQDTILENLTINGAVSVDIDLTNNSLLVKENDSTLEEYKIIKISSEAYDLSNDYIYTKTNAFNEDLITVTNATKVVSDNVLKIRYEDTILDMFSIVTINSDKYDLIKEYLYTKNKEINIDDITLTKGNVEVNDNKLQIKFNEILLEEYYIVSISSTDYDLTKNYIYTKLSDFDNTKVNVINGTSVVLNNKLYIKYENENIDNYDLVKISSEEYDLSNEYILAGGENIDLSKINATNANAMQDENYVYVKYNDIELDKWHKSAFKDQNFYQCVVDSYNERNTANKKILEHLSDEELNKIYSLNCKSKSIEFTDGIEKISNLYYLYFENNNIDKIDLNNNRQLKIIVLSNNKLNDLSLDNIEALTHLSVDGNNIKELKLNDLPVLSELYIGKNQLNEVDLSTLKSLKYLNVSENELVSLDVSNLDKLISLRATNNKISTINLNGTSALESLVLDYNNLANIELPSNSKLNIVSLSDNELESIIFGKNDNLHQIYISNNKLETLNCNGIDNLEELSAWNNNIKSLDISTNKYLKKLYISNNNLKELNVVNNQNLETIKADNNNLTNIIAKDNSKMISLEIYQNNLESIDLDNYKNLEHFNISYNQLKTIDTSSCSNLKRLYANNNKITSVNLNANIERLKLNDNSLTNINLKELNDLDPQNLSLFNNLFETEFAVYKNSIIDFSKELYMVKTPEHIKYQLASISRSSSIDPITKEDTYRIIDSTVLFNYSGHRYVNTRYELIINSQEVDEYFAGYNVYVIEATSDKYIIDAENNYVYTGLDIDSDTILSNISVNYGELKIKDNKLQVIYEEEIIKEFNIINFNVNNLKVINNMIIIRESMDYQDFISNIEMNGVTSKVYSEEALINNGNVEDGMILKIYKDDTKLAEYIITEEYLEFDSSIEIDENNSYIKNIELNTAVDNILTKIDTSGNIIIKDYKGKLLENADLIGTGTKVIIELSSGTVEYTAVVKGDVSGDGKANVADYSKAYQYYKKRITMEEYFIEASDVVKNDTVITMADVSKIYQFIKNRIASLD